MVSGNPGSRSDDGAVYGQPDPIQQQQSEFPAEPVLPHEPPAAAFDPNEPAPPPRAPEPEPEPAVEPPPEPPQRGTYARSLPPPESSTGRPLLAGVAGGVLVAAVGGALLWTGMLGPKPAADVPSSADPALVGRLADIETQIRGLASRPAAPAPADSKALEEVKSRLAALEAAPPSGAAPGAAPDAALAGRLANVEGSLKALTDIMTRLDRQGDAVAAQAQNAERRVAELNDALSKSTTGGTADAGDLDKLAVRVAKIETIAKGLEDDLAKRAVVGTMDRQLRFAYVAESLRAAAERGAPFAGQLATLIVLAPENKALADLKPYAQNGVPSEPALGRELAAIAPEIVRRAQPQAAATPGILDKLKANAEKLVELRSISAPEGTDPAAMASRVVVSADKADIAGALAELAKLPPQVRAPAEAWISKAQARQNAVALARRFASEAMAALGPAAP